MNTEQTIDLSDLKKLLPERAKIEFKKKKGDTGTSLEVSVKIVPYLTHKEHDAVVKSIIDFYGEDLHEVYTETTGYHFYVYLKMSQTQPTTVSI